MRFLLLAILFIGCCPEPQCSPGNTVIHKDDVDGGHNDHYWTCDEFGFWEDRGPAP